jgi:hypothetical protein
MSSFSFLPSNGSKTTHSLPYLWISPANQRGARGQLNIPLAGATIYKKKIIEEQQSTMNTAPIIFFHLFICQLVGSSSMAWSIVYMMLTDDRTVHATTSTYWSTDTHMHMGRYIRHILLHYCQS